MLFGCRRVGEIALSFLKTGAQKLHRNQVIEKVGPEAFNCGILDDGRRRFFPLKTPERISMSFPDTTVQEYLGAFRYKRNIKEEEEKNISK